MILLVVVLAVVGGLIEGRRGVDGEPSGEWLSRTLFVYGLPILLLGFVGCIIIVGLYRFGEHELFVAQAACHGDRACNIAARVQIDLGQRVQRQLGVVEVVMLVVMGLAFWICNAPREARAVVPNPRKWLYNEDTGEYSRILYRHQGDNIYNTKDTYKSRFMANSERIKSRRLAWSGFVSCMIGFIASSFWFFYSLTEGSGILPLASGFVMGGFGLFGLGCLLRFCSRTLEGIGTFIGPPPDPMRGKAAVEKQKVHGDGRFLTPQEIEAAARARPAADAQPAPKQTFND